jgi:hypothetical protein
MRFLPAFLVTLALALPAAAMPATQAPVTVYKSPTCGCCGGWADALREKGYTVVEKAVEDLSPVKRHFKVPDDMQSCHTALIDGYVVEGHVPLEAVEKLLAERPKVRGISLPGMPIGTPGMPGPKTETWTVYTLEDKPRVFWEK